MKPIGDLEDLALPGLMIHPSKNRFVNYNFPSTNLLISMPKNKPPVDIDPIEKSSHYNTFGIECKDVIEGLGLGIGYYIGSAIDKLWRFQFKGKNKSQQIEDLQKAIWHIKQAIRVLETEGESSLDTQNQVDTPDNSEQPLAN